MRLKVLLVGLIIIACAVSAAYVFAINQKQNDSFKPVVKSKNSYKLVFNDEFKGDSLDKSKWNTCYSTYEEKYDGCTNYGNDESEWYLPSQVSVVNGNLSLKYKKQVTLGLARNDQSYTYEKTYDYASGMISTGHYIEKAPEKWSGQYGYFEARMNVPSGQAVWPAFWLLPVDHDWPPEIDIMETLGQNPNELINTYFWKGADGSAQKDSSTYNYKKPITKSWHTFAVDWEPGQIDWYIDDLIVKSVKSDKVPAEKMHIILNLAVGGRLPGNPDKTTPNTGQMLVDYVRVYQK